MEEPTTVGIPMAITGIPRVSLLISLRMLPIPLPGWIPVSVIWILLFILLIVEAASASITMIRLGFVFFAIDNIISCVSIPVSAITPGAILDTFKMLSSGFPRRNRCLVTIISSSAFGPRLSGVLLALPKPTTSIEDLS